MNEIPGMIRPVLLDKVRKPHAKTTKSFVSLPFKKQWPRILSDIIEYPERTTQDHWRKWGRLLTNVRSSNEFASLLSKHDMNPQKVKRETSTKAHVALAIKSFAQVKKVYAEAHMQRIHNKLEEVHKVVKVIKPSRKNVERVLDLTARLHKEGRLAYGIDDDSAPDRKVTNLAILIGHVPEEKKVKVLEMDTQS